MFKILYVDLVSSPRTIECKIAESFPGSEVDFALGWDMACQTFKMCRYDGVVSPIVKSPSDIPAYEAYIEHDSFCKLINDLMPECFVFHPISSLLRYDEQPFSHFIDLHIGWHQSRAAFINQSRNNYLDQLIKTMRAWLYGSLVEGKVDQLSMGCTCNQLSEAAELVGKYHKFFDERIINKIKDGPFIILKQALEEANSKV